MTPLEAEVRAIASGRSTAVCYVWIGDDPPTVHAIPVSRPVDLWILDLAAAYPRAVVREPVEVPA